VNKEILDQAGHRPNRAPKGRQAGRVISKSLFGPLVWLTLEIPGWRTARPGQFVLIQPSFSKRFLPRALSVAGESGGVVSFLISPIGEGTEELCRLEPGQDAWVVGPLGNGFDLSELAGPAPGTTTETVVGVGYDSGTATQGAVCSVPARRLLVVAGGVGMAPFPLLVHRLGQLAGGLIPRDQVVFGGPMPEVVVLLGFRDAGQARAASLLLEALSQARKSGLHCRVSTVVEDGSAGRPEKATDLLAREISPGDRLVACGPVAMSRAVWELAAEMGGVRAWFSLETGMACGVGSCHGCTIATADGSLVRVCREGPVFEGPVVFGGASTARPEVEDSGVRR
jgi:dihydroorotate dehydrogenase electron transfer subunit